MRRGRRKATNELEFQGAVLGWLNEEIRSRPGLGLDRATQEKPRVTSGKRNDLIIWRERRTESAFLTIELKTPTTSIGDLALFDDALEKAQHWKAPYFALWNMQQAELYQTPPVGGLVTPADVIKRWSLDPTVVNAEDWLTDRGSRALKIRATEILDEAWGHEATTGGAGHIIDAEIFVARLSGSIDRLRNILHKEIASKAATKANLRRSLTKIAAEQGFQGFVEDIGYAIAGQIGYRLIGQILFYFALRRKRTELPQLELSPSDPIPFALRTYWAEVRRYDYEALFRPETIEELVEIPEPGQAIIRTLVSTLAAYDWASLTDDVLGAIFERLIPRSEQILLGQFYTPRRVADLLVALTVDGDRPLILDPGCGSGTFLMSAYDFIAWRSGLRHSDILSVLWGFDLSPFATELADINLFRQDFSEMHNFPRIVPGNFFDRSLGETVEFPSPRFSAYHPDKIPVPIPQFDCIVGNPPYLRSQNQNDLDPHYRDQLFSAASHRGIEANAKTDLFVFFIYHALEFMKEGSRIGFVTPASWLASDYAGPLQRLMMNELRVRAVIGSSVESFFPQVDVNTVLIVAEKLSPGAPIAPDEQIRFVMLNRLIVELAASTAGYWDGMLTLVDEIMSVDISVENERLRVKVVNLQGERLALATAPGGARNWSRYLRAPLSYYALFGNDW